MIKGFGTPGPAPAPPEAMADLELVRFISNEKNKKLYIRIDEDSYCPSIISKVF